MNLFLVLMLLLFNILFGGMWVSDRKYGKGKGALLLCIFGDLLAAAIWFMFFVLPPDAFL
jgi:hypothetical protein